MKHALGMIEVKGLVAVVQTADAMLKAAKVQFKGWKKIDDTTCMIFLEGENAAVESAVNTGSAAAKSLGGEIVRIHVIPQPHEDLQSIIQAFGISQQTENGFTETDDLFHSVEAKAVKEEICAVGRKLWLRSYVDGNGGNISCRISDDAVICTPTLLSKHDLKPDDLCLVDLEGNQLAGVLKRTSEVFLHNEIYKAVPQAKAVVHCHPPHATAYAITGHVPPTPVIPEFDVFVGHIAITPYETPGTKKFAETVLPHVKDHNTIILGNHGIVCWADTPTHAEWYAENLETYCWTLLIGRQLGFPVVKISPEKEKELLSIKRRLGLPDPRFNANKSSVSNQPESPVAPASSINEWSMKKSVKTISDADIDVIIKAVVKELSARIKQE
jgi:L-fuculose-phosphate aldolase